MVNIPGVRLGYPPLPIPLIVLRAMAYYIGLCRNVNPARRFNPIRLVFHTLHIASIPTLHPPPQWVVLSTPAPPLPPQWMTPHTQIRRACTYMLQVHTGGEGPLANFILFLYI